MENREKIAWAGGLFEGEGCFTHNHGQPRAQIGMLDKEPLTKMKEYTGLGSVLGPWNSPSRLNPIYEWRVYGFEKVQALLAILWPWLSNRRRERAVSLLKEKR